MLKLMIVTIIDGVPRVLAGEERTIDEFREDAKRISGNNGAKAVVWLLDSDGEYPWYRYDSGVETYLCDNEGVPMAQTMEDESYA